MNKKIQFIIIVLALLVPSQIVGQITESFTEPYDQRQLAVSQNQRLTFVGVKAGSAVSEGTLLAELEIEPLKQQLRLLELRAGSRAALKAAQTRVKVRKAKLDALTNISDDGFANPAEILKSEWEYEEAVAERDLAKLQIDESQIAVAKMKAEIRQKQIFSPIKGIVTEVFYKPGEVVGSGDSRFANIVQLERLKVRFYLGLPAIEQLNVGDSVDLLLNRKKPIVGKVEFVSPITSPDSGTARVEVVIENPDLAIRSGIPCSWQGPQIRQTAISIRNSKRGSTK